MDVLQSLAALAGFALGVTYVLGGLIVNVHLSRYGVTEYQILRAKYLVVGLVYLVNLLGNTVLALIPTFLLLAVPPVYIQVIGVASLLAALILLIVWHSREPRWGFLTLWRFWVLLSAISLIFPLTILIRLILTRQPSDTFSVLLVVEAVVIGLLALMAQTYYYARFGYSEATVLGGALDTTGTGVAVRVQLAGEPEKMSFLPQMGVPMEADNLSGEVLLLDETDSDYILAIPRDGALRAVKVNKEVVKGILYLGYDLPSDSTPRERKKRARSRQ